MKAMKKAAVLVAVILTIAMCFAFSASASSIEFIDGNITYVLVSNSWFNVRRVDTEAEGKIVIPETYQGGRVRYIEDGAFLNCSKITEVVLSDKISEIGDYAFKNCTSLEKITVGKGVSLIGSNAFGNCVSLKEIAVSADNKNFSTDENGLLYNKDKTTLVWCPASVAGKSFTVPENVKRIAVTAFSSCTELENISFAGETPALELGAFKGTAFYNNAANRIGGGLYLGDCLLEVSSGVNGEFTVREGTSYIAENVFAGRRITSVILPDSLKVIGNHAFNNSDIAVINFNKVEIIGDYAFYDCDRLKNFVIPSTVKEIGSYAFAQTGPETVLIKIGVEKMYSSSFSFESFVPGEIFFEGSKEQWESVEILGANTSHPYVEYFNHPEAAHPFTNYVSNNDEEYYKSGTETAYCDYGCGLSDTRIAERTKVLGTVENFKATYTGGKVVLTWDEVENASGYAVFENVNGKWVRYTNTKALTYTPENISGSSKHLYAVRAYSSGVEGDTHYFAYAPGYATVEIETSDLGSPAKITTEQSSSAIRLTWSAVKGADGYRVYQKVADGWKALGNTEKTTATLTNLSPATQYTYAIKAGKIVNGKVNWSVSYTTVIVQTKTEAPKNLTATQGDTAIKLTWSAVKGADAYRVYQKKGDSWKLLASTSKLEYTIGGLRSGEKYSFAVRTYAASINGSYGGEYSIINTATRTLTPLVRVSSPSVGKIQLSWTDEIGSDGYAVYYKLNDGAYKIYKTYADAQTLIFSNLKGGDTYTFAVRSGIKTENGVVWSGYQEKSVTLEYRVQRYLNAVKNGTYYIETHDGEGYYDGVALKNGNACVRMNYAGEIFRMVYNKSTGKVYEIYDSEKQYVVSEDDGTVAELVSELAGLDINMKVIKSTKEKIGSKTYFVEYQITEDGFTDKYYFDGNKLVMEELSFEGESVRYYYSQFTTNVPDSLFTIPSGYKQVKA